MTAEWGSCSPVFDRAIGPAVSAIPVAGKAPRRGRRRARQPLWPLAGRPALVVRPEAEDGTGIDAEAFAGLDVRGRAVLVQTNWDRHWGTDEYLSGGHPFLTTTPHTPRRSRTYSFQLRCRLSRSTECLSSSWRSSYRRWILEGTPTDLDGRARGFEDGI